MDLDDQVMKSFKVASVFYAKDMYHQQGAPVPLALSSITSLDFDSTGTLCIAAGRMAHVFDCTTATHLGMVQEERSPSAYAGTNPGNSVHLARFIPGREDAVLCAMGNGEVRMYSNTTGSTVKVFQGHNQPVNTIDFNMTMPSNQANTAASSFTFMTTANGEGLRLWDLRTRACQAVLKQEDIHGTCHGCFDPQGMVFAVATEKPNVSLSAPSHYMLRLYDARNWQQGPFGIFDFSASSSSQCTWTGLQFSPNGKEILIGTVPEAPLILIDSFECKVLGYLHGRQESDLKTMPMDSVCWTPDNKYILATSEPDSVLCWSRQTLEPITRFDGKHSSTPTACRFNSCLGMFVTACSNVAMWLPEE